MVWMQTIDEFALFYEKGPYAFYQTSTGNSPSNIHLPLIFGYGRF